MCITQGLTPASPGQLLVGAGAWVGQSSTGRVEMLLGEKEVTYGQTA